MSEMCNKIINLAQRQVGYKETGDNVTKYARWFDTTAWQWFNTKKQGAEWCAIFVCWLFAQNETLGKDKAYTFLGCPKNKNDNLAAGCPYFYQYLVNKGYKVDKKAGLPGDIIFFNAKCSHVGIIEKVDDKKYYTIEGNKGNMVKRCSHARGSSTIYGICRPKWSEVDPKPTPTPTPTPTPEPTPTPTPSGKKYKVNAKRGLNLRASPGVIYRKTGALNYGQIVTIQKTQSGWGMVSANHWCSMQYLVKV